MQEIELSDKEWAFLKRRLFNYGLSALCSFPSQVKLVHGKEYIVYDLEKDYESVIDNEY